MNDLILLAFSSLWMGILTSISPCPLASNIAALSFISYRISQKTIVLISGVLYSLGRSVTYVALSFLIIKAAINIPFLSSFLEKYINKVLGLFLILVGMYLLDLLKMNLPSFVPSEKLQERADRLGLLGIFILGGLFALALCPVSAAIFFGGLIPLAIKNQSAILLPSIYGIGTGLPVLLFGFLIASGVDYVNHLYHLGRIDYYARKVTGVVFILIGIYYVLVYIWGVL